MDGQRCGQRPRERGGISGRARHLLGALLVAGLIGCQGEPRSPVGITGPDDTDRGGNIGTSSSTSALVGTWSTFILISASGDLQEWTTRWTFRADRTCDFKRTTFSYVEGFPRTVERTCTYVDQNSTAVVTFVDPPVTQTIPYSVPGTTRERLIIEGVEYERVE